MLPEELIKLADLFDQETQKLERRPSHEMPTRNEQEVLDKVDGAKFLLDRVRSKMRGHRGDVGWWDKFVLKRKITQIEEKIRELDNLL
jgi:hypothetical protein